MTKRKKHKIVVVIICASFLQGLQFVLSPVLGQIAEHFSDIDMSLIQMVITVPAIVSVFVALLSGWLALKISKKKLLLFAAFLAGTAGLMPTVADSFWMLFFSRMVYGISLGLATTLNTAIVADFFDGDARTSMMGIQAASIGTGMVCITTLSGWIGKNNFENSYWINILGFVAFALILCCLPEKRPVNTEKKEEIRLCKDVSIASGFAFLEFFFLITFSTNIALHLGGTLTGDSTIAGNLIGIFSGIQIVAGLLLGRVTRYFGKYTMPAAMMSFSIGAVLLIVFPGNLPLLVISALFCGFSQGIFIPTGMVTVSNAVAPAAVTMASAVFTSAMSMGQFFSPIVLNMLSNKIFGDVTTGNVYKLAAAGMTASAVLSVWWKKKDHGKENKFETIK